MRTEVSWRKGREMTDFGEIKAVDIRESWPNEARDFTPWLAENIDRLSNALGMDLEVTTCEADIGDFSLDLLAKDLGSGRPVVIENQFGATNHDHLGKVITYAAGVDAVAVIWLMESMRDEHRQALEWRVLPADLKNLGICNGGGGFGGRDQLLREEVACLASASR